MDAKRNEGDAVIDGLSCAEVTIVHLFTSVVQATKRRGHRESQ